MNKIKVEFDHCYGIKKLRHDFDFKGRTTIALYSPNGVMKTSFAKTFKDISNNTDSKDLIFPENVTLRKVTDEIGNELKGENIFVIEPYNETYKSEKVSVLLVNAKLKNEYEKIHLTIDEKKDNLFRELSKMSGVKVGIEEVISSVFTKSSNNFFKAIGRIKDEVLDDSPPLFDLIIYKNIFTDKIESFLNGSDIKEKIEKYINKYNDLLGKSRFFKKGIFNHTNASTIAKNLKDNGFFKAKHSINLYSENGNTEIKDEKELTTLIDKEKQDILTDPELLKIFESLDKKISANQELRDFREYLLLNINIVPELSNLEAFKDKIWISYLKVQKDLFQILLSEYEIGKKQIEEIIKKAKEESTLWSNVINEFNERFSVPFKLSVGNQEQVILNSQAPVVQFEFNDYNGNKNVTESDLRNVLSTGEKRALYLLNIIFEVQARKESQINTLFIIDDIADSFDYKNKYAIIEYLKDISSIPGFYQIILTHNYDFFRTVSLRLDMGREHKLNTDKNQTGVSIYIEKYQHNPFSYWKKHLSSDNNMLIASIPFIRNLAEFMGDEHSFNKLTSLLHYKHDTSGITVKDLEDHIKNVLKDQANLSLNDPSSNAVDLIFSVSNQILQETNDNMDLEKKICLSIAIRLKAEMHMVKKISDEPFWKSITKNQGYYLTERFISLPNLNQNEIKAIEQVNLMTPENIHINSFMYEPILDMSNHHLKTLYNEISLL